MASASVTFTCKECDHEREVSLGMPMEILDFVRFLGLHQKCLICEGTDMSVGEIKSKTENSLSFSE